MLSPQAAAQLCASGEFDLAQLLDLVEPGLLRTTVYLVYSEKLLTLVMVGNLYSSLKAFSVAPYIRM